MANLGSFICKGCDFNIDLSTAVNGVVSCPYCNNTYTLPKESGGEKLLYSLRQGESLLDKSDFDGAYEEYKKASELDESEPEAYFGMALADFKVRFIKYVTEEGKPGLQAICAETGEKKFCDDDNYLLALKYATASQREEYKRRAGDIDYIRSEFLNLENSGVDYDCFICVKVTSEDGKKTGDSEDADYIYHLLKRKGYNPFYSEYEIHGRQGADYEAYILYALKKSECMLVVCRDEKYLQTPWVKNEYTRFLNLIGDGEKESDGITVVFNGSPISKLPGRRGSLQGINFDSRAADEQIVEFVDRHTPAAKAKKEAQRQAALRAEAEREARFAEQARLLEEQRKAFEEQQKNMAAQFEMLKSASSTGTILPVFSVEKLKNLVSSCDYSAALSYFKSFDKIPDPDGYYLAAIALLEGKKAFLTPRERIDKAIRYLNEAIAKEDKAIYYYFLAYIKYDYFERKYLNTSPGYKELFALACVKGVTNGEVNGLYTLLRVARPDCL